MLKSGFLIIGLIWALSGLGQRVYKPSSVLATGTWYKIAIQQPGIYKIDLAFLNGLGISTINLQSSSIRLYGNGGGVLPEPCSATVVDDLEENAIQVMDGGDGMFNGSDYFLFYAGGPNNWLKDSLNQQFTHQKNVYSDQSFYFITIGGPGKRVDKIKWNVPPANTVRTFDDRYYYEPDLTNFLSSGKSWYAEEFGNGQGKLSSRNFTIPLTQLTGEPVKIISNCISRSIGGSSRFMVLHNNAPLIQHEFQELSTSNLDLFARTSQLNAGFIPSSPISLTYTYQSGAQGAQGWLNWFEVFAQRNLTMAGTSQLLFRDWNSVGSGHVNEFVLSEAGPTTRVWDVTNALAPVEMDAVLTGRELKFTNDGSRLHEYIAFNNTEFLVPAMVGKVENQDLHASSPAGLLVVTHARFLDQARRLADHHLQKDKLKVVLVTVEQVYNEFASGLPDPTAIRNFVKMYYDKAGNDSANRPSYLLLFGDASYDYKGRLKNNTNFVPAYQSEQSLDPLGTYTSDDYFGFLDDFENINADTIMNLLDIGIGRIPASTIEQAKSYVDKLIGYSDPVNLGAWRNQLTFIADDEDNNLHVRDAEVLTATASATNALFLQRKIYLDAYRQVGDPAGSRYPLVNQQIDQQIQKGTLIWNYSGHGGFRRLAEEVVLDQDVVNSWDNAGKLPLFITATCDFAPFDNPTIHSLGEDILLRQQTGAIALMTTTRLVFAYSNRIMNRNYLLAALQPANDGKYLSLGEAVKKAKNTTYQYFGDISNNRKFTLLGDPALTLSFPKYRVQTDSVNQVVTGLVPDTLTALRFCTVSGSVTDTKGQLLPDFNGTVYPVVFDKIRKARTLGNDPSSIREEFDVQDHILFKGKATVKNGRFSFSFIVPQDIRYQPGYGRISYYADNGETDANGSFTNIIIGGSQQLSTDKTGPEIDAFINDKKFVNGFTLYDRAILEIELNDISGINIVSTGIDHDVTAIIDGDAGKHYVLNDNYEPELNSFQKGRIRFALPVLEEGLHTIRIKAWDVVNNSNEVSYSFRVIKKRNYSILQLQNFPNPFSSATTFRFTHDLDVPDIELDIKIYSSEGRLVKTIRNTIIYSGNRSLEVTWDRKNDEGNRLPKGIYYYVLSLSATNGARAARAAQMVIL